MPLSSVFNTVTFAPLSNKQLTKRTAAPRVFVCTYGEWTAGLLLQNDLTLFLANAPMRGTPDYGEWTAGLLMQNDLTLLWRMDRWTATAE